jgi:coenzyme Q-binding protein COQ10
VPHIGEQRRLPWSCEQMFDLVADVARYGEFLPWVVATRVKSDSGTEMVADMLVGFHALNEKFTSRVRKQRPRSIVVDYLDGPLRKLENEWTFSPDEGGGCVIDFRVDFTFRNAVFEKLAGQYMDRAFRKMVSAFETRAQALYGAAQDAAEPAGVRIPE